jgi:anti-anti-sigma regulatory factor
MPGGLDVTVDFTMQGDAGLLVARLSGTLGLSEAVQVRTHLLKCLAEQPGALLVDLAGLAVSNELALSVFTAVVRQAVRWPGTPVLLCAPQPATAVMLASAVYRRLPVFPSLDRARTLLDSSPSALPSVAEDLLPTVGAARQSRNVVTEACLMWDLPHLVGPACLIASELVSNAVDHAGTMMTLRVSLGRRFFFVALRDGSTAEPVTGTPDVVSARGRGLRIVDATAHSWGFLPARDGKVVWASLALRPR